MQDLNQSAQAILDKIDASQILMTGAYGYAGAGQIIAPGVMQNATITEAMRMDYNGDIQSVIDATYYNANMLLEQQHTQAMANLDLAIDDLVDATAVLMTAQAIASMAASADTVEEKLQMQAILETNDMQISAADTSAYNTALGAVQAYARDAGAFLAASRNTALTGAVDAYANQSGVSLYGGTAAYSATADIISISAGSAFGVGFQGFLTGSTVSLSDVYAAGYGS